MAAARLKLRILIVTGTVGLVCSLLLAGSVLWKVPTRVKVTLLVTHLQFEIADQSRRAVLLPNRASASRVTSTTFDSAEFVFGHAFDQAAAPVRLSRLQESVTSPFVSLATVDGDRSAIHIRPIPMHVGGSVELQILTPSHRECELPSCLTSEIAVRVRAAKPVSAVIEAPGGGIKVESANALVVTEGTSGSSIRTLDAPTTEPLVATITGNDTLHLAALQPTLRPSESLVNQGFAVIELRSDREEPVTGERVSALSGESPSRLEFLANTRQPLEFKGPELLQVGGRDRFELLNVVRRNGYFEVSAVGTASRLALGVQSSWRDLRSTLFEAIAGDSSVATWLSATWIAWGALFALLEIGLRAREWIGKERPSGSEDKSDSIGARSVTVLFLASDPFKHNALSLDEEIRQIREKLRAAGARHVELRSAWAVRSTDLQQLLLEERPAVVHFSGHGNDASEIVLMDEQGQPKPVSGPALVGLFGQFSKDVRLVVLNACSSGAQAQAIAQVVGCAIGMTRPIDDDAAIVFSSAFYRALGFGESVGTAFLLGRNALLLEGIPDHDTPELFQGKSVNPDRLAFVSPYEEQASDERVSRDA